MLVCKWLQLFIFDEVAVDEAAVAPDIVRAVDKRKHFGFT